MDLVRVDFALIPDEPLFGSVVTASQEITHEFYYNENIIDENIFPPHVSLLICTVPRETLNQISVDLESVIIVNLPELAPVSIEPSSGGYVKLNIERSAQIMAAHEAVLEIAAKAREGIGGNDKYGSAYILDSFDPHLSLAKVEYRDQKRASIIGRRAVGELRPTSTRALELCDIGERSERWEVLASYTDQGPNT